MPMTDQFILGIDAGTSVVKAVLFSRDGSESRAVARRTTLYSPQLGWAEADMHEIWQKVVECVRELLAMPEISGQQIAAIGVTGNMVGAWMIDKCGNPVRKAILWCDARSQAWIDEKLDQDPQFMSTIFKSTGSVMQQGCTLPVVKWLTDNEPESMDNAAHILCCKDWLTYKMTGTIQVDPTEVVGMPGSAQDRGYSDAMFKHLEVAAYRYLFPDVVPSDAIVGGLLGPVADRLGLSPGTPVVAGVGDVPAVVLGIGAMALGTACSILGTNILNGVVTDQPVFAPSDLGLLFMLPGERWMRTMVNVAGTTNLDWFVSRFCQDLVAQADTPGAVFDELGALAALSPIGANGILYLPYLSTQGIITPFVEPKARAEFFGLHDEHTRGDIVRAVYEGVALSIYDSFLQIPGRIEEIRLAGGGARSEFWSQMIADCTGKSVRVMAGKEFGAKGAALLAGVGIGWYKDVQDASQVASKTARRHEPDPVAQERYAAVFERFKRLQLSLVEIWNA